MAAMQTDSLPDGGGTVGEEVEGVINKLVKDRSPIRALARIVRLTRGNRYVRHYWTSEAQTGGWVGEADPRNETMGPVLAELDYPVFEQFAQPFASNILLQDSDIDIGAELGIQVSDTFAIQEGVAFLRGSGVRQPRGILSYPTAATGDLAGRPFGTIEIRTIDFAAAVTAAASPIYDGLIDAWYSMRAEHRQNAVWMCASTTLSRLRQVKDMQGNYIWQRSNVAGQPDTLLGAPVFTNEDCDAIASGKTPIILADWQRAYTLVDKAGIIILKDPYTTKGFTKFYSTKRVGGGLDNSNAVKLIKAQ
jgi:HK97 family phage major capsid protein